MKYCRYALDTPPRVLSSGGRKKSLRHGIGRWMRPRQRKDSFGAALAHPILNAPNAPMTDSEEIEPEQSGITLSGLPRMKMTPGRDAGYDGGELLTRVADNLHPKYRAAGVPACDRASHSFGTKKVGLETRTWIGGRGHSTGGGSFVARSFVPVEERGDRQE